MKSIFNIPTNNPNIIYKKETIYKLRTSYKKIYIDMDDNSADAIYELLTNNKIQNSKSDVELFYLGFYYEYIIKNINKAIEYYYNASKNGYFYATMSLARYYKEIGDVYESIKLHELSMKLSNNNEIVIESTYNLGKIYYSMKDYNKAAYYFCFHCSLAKSNLYDYINITQYNVEWANYLHPWWYIRNKKSFNKIIKILLLISKNRTRSKLKYIECFTKNICLMVIGCSIKNYKMQIVDK